MVRALLQLAIVAPSASAGAYYVDNSSAASSDAGPGTPSQPYSTISAAVAARAGAGVTIVVRPGTYREDVEIMDSNDTSQPFVIRADADGVVVDGADDFSGSAQWTRTSGSVYLAAGVTWSPTQVFADSVALAPSTASPALIPAGAFRYVAGAGLYVNLGADDPGVHAMLVGRRTYGFHIGAHAHVVLEGFRVTRAEDRGIYVEGGSDSCTIRGNEVDHAHRFGIGVEACTGVLIEHNLATDNADNGIALTLGSTGCTVQDNECARNAVPGAFHSGSGVYLYQAPANLIQRNRLHDNEDEGLNFAAGANNNLSLQNIAWRNHDHGFDNFASTGNVHIGDVAYANTYDGIAVDGGATATRLYDCIAVDNGLPTNRFDLWVDEMSNGGFESDYNLFWNSTARAPIRYTTGIYATIAEYSAASGEDTHSLQADPSFVDPASSDFHLRAGSPAIDSGDSDLPAWPTTDADGIARIDDPATPNSGTGPVPYTDRGALEYNPAGTLAVGATPGRAGAQVTPNPVVGRARLVFGTGAPGPVSVRIFDAAGRCVRTLALSESMPAGVHELALAPRRDDGGPLGAGVYFYEIHAGSVPLVGRFAVLR